MDSANTFTFDAGPDATFGAEWYVNGELVAKTTNDICWSRNRNSAAVFSISDIESGRFFYRVSSPLPARAALAFAFFGRRRISEISFITPMDCLRQNNMSKPT